MQDFICWVNENLSTLLAFGAFVFGIVQYMRAQKWKKAEFAAKEIEKFQNDPDIKFARLLLDSDGRSLRVPESLKNEDDTEEFLIHTWEKMEKALDAGWWPDDREGYSTEDMLYRDAFDRLFSFFCTIYYHLDRNLIVLEDVGILEYWLERINSPKHYGHKPIFNEFITTYFECVFGLMQKFGIDPKEVKTKDDRE
ncbi:MAG: hypothetical protein AB7E76_14260 [Deferribacterales bacterium]